MLKSRKVRVISSLAALAVAAIVILILLSAGPRLAPPRTLELKAYDISEPPPPPANSASGAPALAVTSPPPPEEMAGPGDSNGSGNMAAMTPVEITVPKLAYAYKLGFRLPGDGIATAQEAHRTACERMGATRCQLLGMSRGAAEDTEVAAFLKLRVAAGEAKRFSDEAIRVVAAAGGRAISTNVTADDVSKEIVDAEARIHQRELLVSRLTEILRTRRGTVSELVEAERSVAQAQEELDQTKGWLTELRGRVAMSDLEINYAAAAPNVSPPASSGQLGDAVMDSIAGFLIGVKTLLTLLIYLLPWLLVATPFAYFAWRRRHRAHAKPESVIPEAGDES
jgi:hypothetical protein